MFGSFYDEGVICGESRVDFLCEYKEGEVLGDDLIVDIDLYG